MGHALVSCLWRLRAGHFAIKTLIRIVRDIKTIPSIVLTAVGSLTGNQNIFRMDGCAGRGMGMHKDFSDINEWTEEELLQIMDTLKG